MTQLAARIDMKFTVDEEPETVSTTDDTKVTNQWFYTVTKLTVKNINQKSDLILLGRDNQYDDTYSTAKDITLQNGVALPFYTYEKLNTTLTPLSIYVTGDLQKIQVTTTFNEDMTIQNVTKGSIIEEEKDHSYKYEDFNPTTALEGCTTNGIIHGNRYELTGKISMKTQRINFTVSTTPWEGVEKFVVDVVIADLKYLFVRETKVVMANISEYKIEFASSSNITIDQPSYATYEKYELKGNVMEREDTQKLPSDERALFAVATELEDIALNDEYFVSRNLYPNVDFYTGLIYRAIGFDPAMFTTLFALGRIPGWIAQYREMLADPNTKIGRPRQVYTGPVERDFVPMDER